MSMFDAYAKAGLIFGVEGGGGTSDFEQLTNRPEVNGNLIDKNSTNASLGISKTYTLNNTTIAGHIVFDIPVETITDIYNMMVKGAVCILSDTPGNIHRLVSSADTDGDNVYVIVQYDDILIRYVDDGTHTYKERIEVDENLSSTSVNPVMNKTVKTKIDAVEAELANKQSKLTASTNITIENGLISSYQPTAINPFTLAFGNEDYNGSAPKQITAEKIGAATKDFVNSSIATNTAFFKGTFDSTDDLPSTGVTNNDYAFIVVYEELEPSTVKQYDRYKYSAEIDDDTDEVVGWVYEYTLNNSSFTADEWATIQSGLKDTDKTQIETNTSVIADIVANMPDSPEDINAQPKSLIIESEFDGEGVTITDSRYVESGTVNYSKLYSDILIAFNDGMDTYFRVDAGNIADIKCVTVVPDDNLILFEGMIMYTIIIAALSEDAISIVALYDVEPSDSLKDADDGQLTTAKAQKDYFQQKITSSDKIPYSNISGTPSLSAVATSGSYNDLSNKPSIPSAQQQTNWNSTSGITSIANKPSNLVLGYSGTTSTAAALKIVTCTQAQYDASSKSDDTIYLIKS